MKPIGLLFLLCKWCRFRPLGVRSRHLCPCRSRATMLTTLTINRLLVNSHSIGPRFRLVNGRSPVNICCFIYLFIYSTCWITRRVLVVAKGSSKDRLRILKGSWRKAKEARPITASGLTWSDQDSVRIEAGRFEFSSCHQSDPTEPNRIQTANCLISWIQIPSQSKLIRIHANPIRNQPQAGSDLDPIGAKANPIQSNPTWLRLQAGACWGPSHVTWWRHGVASVTTDGRAARRASQRILKKKKKKKTAKNKKENCKELSHGQRHVVLFGTGTWPGDVTREMNTATASRAPLRRSDWPRLRPIQWHLAYLGLHSFIYFNTN